jgi:hypothetical protein
MILETPSGTTWRIDDALHKLALRAALPGARVFDHAADALRRARAAGMADADRLVLALSASWLVNSPAHSHVLRRWALPPQRDRWLALIAALDGGPEEWTARGDRAAVAEIARHLGDEPWVIEAISKVLALLVPESAPLMPPAARAFVLGATNDEGPASFVAMIDWLAASTLRVYAELAAIAREHLEVPLDAAQVLDRLLWFDSEGHRAFAAQLKARST